MKAQAAKAQSLQDDAPRRGGRLPAGTDPQKRHQIIEGASRVFTSVGYDAASMNDVAREADVSKATLYVYFPNKEKLFAAICGEKRDRNIGEMIAMLDVTRPLEPVLTDFGVQLITRLSQPFVMAAQRIVIGVAERMPDVGREFFDAGPMRLVKAFADFLKHHADAGHLDLDDPRLAAVQFIELSQATIFRPRLYAAFPDAPTTEEIDKVVGSAVRMFLAAYAL